MVGIDALKATLTDYYDASFSGARKQVDLDAAQAERRAMEQIAASKMAGSGAYQKTVGADIRKQKEATLGSMLSANSIAKAGAFTDLFKQQQAQQFEVDQMNRARKFQTDDTLRDTLFGVANMGLNAFMPGVAAGTNTAVGYNISDFLTQGKYQYKKQ